MKKLIIILFIISNLHGYTQNQVVRFGGKIGANYSWLDLSTNAEYNGGDYAGSFGLISNISIHKNISICTGLELVKLRDKGHVLIFSNMIDPVTGLINQDYAYSTYEVNPLYLKIPVTARFSTNQIKNKLKIFGELGNGLSFLLNAKDYYTKYDKNDNEISTDSGKNSSYTTTKFSAIISVGVEVPFQKSHMFRFGLLFDYCLSDMDNNTFVKLKNHYAEFFIAFLY